jgi:hypothetical protein
LSKVGVNHQSGGTEIACNSVLKEVKNNQPSGKKITKVTNQATKVRMTNARGKG